MLSMRTSQDGHGGNRGRMVQVFLSLPTIHAYLFFLGVEWKYGVFLGSSLRQFPSLLELAPVCFTILLFIFFWVMIFSARIIKQYDPFCFCFPKTQLNFWFVDGIPFCSQCYYGFISITFAFGYLNGDPEERGRIAYAYSSS